MNDVDALIAHLEKLNEYRTVRLGAADDDPVEQRGGEYTEIIAALREQQAELEKAKIYAINCKLGNVDASDGDLQSEIVRLRARVADLEGCIDVLQQTLLEVSHAQSAGPGWYTRGDNGLFQQVSTWVRKGQEAINAVRLEGDGDE